MKVKIKDFKVAMDVKTNGVEFEVRDNDDTFRGDCFVTKTGLVWCEGKTTKSNGKNIKWDDFIAWANSQ